MPASQYSEYSKPHLQDLRQPTRPDSVPTTLQNLDQIEEFDGQIWGLEIQNNDEL